MKSKSIFLTILLACSTSLLIAQGTWMQKADCPGAQRWDAVGFSIGTKGYLGTGSSELGPLKDFWEYDPVANFWTQKADVGEYGRDLAVGFSINGKGYIALGWGFIDFWEYSPEQNIWMRKADFPGFERTSPIGFSAGNKGYVGLGNLGEFGLSDLWEYDPVIDTWIQVADYPDAPRTQAVAFSVGDKGYAGLGWDFWYSVGREFYEFNPALNEWTRVADFPGSSRVEAVAFSAGNRGFVGTGYVPFESEDLNDFYEYDPSVNAWTQCVNYPMKTSYAVGFGIGNIGYGTAWNAEFWEYIPEGVVDCIVPTGLNTTKITTSTTKLDWDDVSGAAGYGIRYKIVGDKEWTLKTATTSAKKIEGLQPGMDYVWSVRTYCSVTPPAVTSAWSPNQSFTTASLRLETPVSTSLDVNPNPFQQSATITYSTMDDASVQIALYDISGKLMKMLVNANVSSGMHTLSLSSEGLSQGIYLLKFQVNDELIIRKVVIE